MGVSDIDAFADKCATTNVDSKVIVSSSGFRSTARKKAAARGITCIELSEVESFHWLMMTEVREYRRHYASIDLRVMFADEMPESIVAIFDAEGDLASEAQLGRFVMSNVPRPDEPDSQVGKIVPVMLRILTPDWIGQDSNDRMWKIDHILASTSFETIKTVSAVERHRYAGGGKDYAFASAPVDVAGTNARLMMVRNEDDTTGIYLVPEGGKFPENIVTETELREVYQDAKEQQLLPRGQG